ncbi:HD domain-containing protein [Flavobacterium sp. ZT3R18]|uniref:HD domain-containing protein n=1 Tax=Flavobacterium sp. ZT3R18 TaxID=2594429 RepID=UPI00117B99E2|nr:HD domain-containing protein [Flavobacterium sp. ZT3R18]TRX35041.1 HD domain-containing protein [Flavobacterium sp. ZT3R18]
MKNWDLLCHTVIDTLIEKLASYLTYHDWKRTEHIIKMAEYIAHQEHIPEEDILLIKTAALFHDSGFITSTSEGHKQESIRLAKIKLPEFDYTKQEIELIAGMIQATSIPQAPKTKLECILADAELEYLGTDTFKYIGNKLYQEIKHSNPNLSLEEWNEIQIKFMQAHVYHTPYCIQNRTPKKEENLELLIQQRNNFGKSE